MNLSKKQKFDIKSKNVDELIAILQSNGFPAYRAKQINDWVFKKGVRSYEEMKNLPKDLIEFLKGNAVLNNCEIELIRTSKDGTRKILLKLADKQFIEMILMEEEGRYTLCLSSQVGCPLNCSFCVTGKIGFKRNLTIAEYVDQVLIAEDILGRDKSITNLVFMGMGEPLLNLDNLIPALRLLLSPQAVAISTRRVTVSTVGIPEGIKQLGEADLGVNLALSLNATTDSLRNVLMPINTQYPIKEIIKACKEFPLTKRRRITFAYVLLKDFNDSIEDAKRLVKLVKSIPCKVNLIPFNPTSLTAFEKPDEKKVEQFRGILDKKDFMVSVRYSKGLDIEAACGQLAGKKK